MRNIAILLTGLFLAKAAAVVLFLLPATGLAEGSAFLTWLGQNYGLRVGLLAVTGLALYGTVALMIAASLLGQNTSPAAPAAKQPLPIPGPPTRPGRQPATQAQRSRVKPGTPRPQPSRVSTGA